MMQGHVGARGPRLTKAQYHLGHPDAEICPVGKDNLWTEGKGDVVAVIDAVRKANPTLSSDGYGTEQNWRFDAARHARHREDMTDSDEVEEFLASALFLTLAAPFKLKHTGSGFSSYGWKHVVEELAGRYVSNGMFICAALSLGWKVQSFPGSPNATINLSIKARDLTLTPAQAHAWSQFLRA